MALTRRPKIPRVRLRLAFKRDIADAWTNFRQKHPHFTPYAFVLYGVDGEMPRLWPVVLTEESLREVAQRYVENGNHDTVAESIADLRFSVADSPHLLELLKATPNVDAIVKPHLVRPGGICGYDVLTEAAMDALGQLDGESFFGSGAKRARILLLIKIEDTEDSVMLASARLLNPKPVFLRFEKVTKIEGTYANCHALAIARDGRRVYSTGSRRSLEETEGWETDFIQEIVAYDLSNRRLVRRWAFKFVGPGDSGRAIALTQDGKSIFALRAKYDESEPGSLLMRFSSNSRRPNGQFRIQGEPSSFALSLDGLRLAVGMSNKRVNLFDADFRLLLSRRLGQTPRGLCFLRSGDLLVATGATVFRLNKRTLATKSRFRIRADCLVIDNRERFLAVSQRFSRPGFHFGDREGFGVGLLRLPSFKPAGQFNVPGCQARTVAISADGHRLACAAHAIGKNKCWVYVFEASTGTEIGRRKTKLVHDLAFLPDNRTLAIATSGMTTNEPIEMWNPTAPGQPISVANRNYS